MKKAEEYIDKVLSESSWSRIIQHVEGDKDFAVISAYQHESGKGKKENKLEEEENIARHRALKEDIKKLKYGYIEQDSGYTYTNKKTGESESRQEMSFFVPNMNYDDAMALAEKYKQESILVKNKDKGFVLVYAKDGVDEEGHPFHKNQIGLKFKSEKDKNGKITFDPAVLKYAYSSLIRANKNQRAPRNKEETDEDKKNKKENRFAYVVESICEGIIPSRTSVMMRHNYIVWRDILK